MSKLLSIGDVLRTHPHPRFWGCAVVLTAKDATKDFHPLGHIGITPLVFDHEFTIDELTSTALTILNLEERIRISPSVYESTGITACIGIYSRKKSKKSPAIIGQTDVMSIPKPHLSFRVGDRRDGGWPLCGSPTEYIGAEAVHAWRSINDRESYLREQEIAERSHEEMLVRLKAARKRN